MRDTVVVSAQRLAVDGACIQLVGEHVYDRAELSGMRSSTRTALVIAAVVLAVVVAGWILTLVLWKAGGKTEGPRRAASHPVRLQA